MSVKTDRLLRTNSRGDDDNDDDDDAFWAKSQKCKICSVVM
jgi:hypothetical protein